MTHRRPTTHELLKRLKEADEALSKGQARFVNVAKVVGELNDLDLLDSAQVWNLIRELLKEITPEHYTGSIPPQKSYESSIKGQELFAFSWTSQRLAKKMYLKFAVKSCLSYRMKKKRLRRQVFVNPSATLTLRVF